jgi:hypothetical protein
MGGQALYEIVGDSRVQTVVRTAQNINAPFLFVRGRIFRFHDGTFLQQSGSLDQRKPAFSKTGIARLKNECFDHCCRTC